MPLFYKVKIELINLINQTKTKIDKIVNIVTQYLTLLTKIKSMENDNYHLQWKQWKHQI